MGDPVRELIGKMLTIDPEHRITIPEIRAHPWYQQVPDTAALLLSLSCPTEEEMDDGILKELEVFGFNRDVAVQSVKNNKHNAETTAYYLLLEKKRCSPEQAAVDTEQGISRISEFQDFEDERLGNPEGDDPTLATAEAQAADEASASSRRQMKRSRKKNTAGVLQQNGEADAVLAHAQAEVDAEGNALVVDAPGSEGKEGKKHMRSVRSPGCARLKNRPRNQQGGYPGKGGEKGNGKGSAPPAAPAPGLI